MVSIEIVLNPVHQDESPNNTPKGVEDEDLNITTRASMNGTRPSPDDLRPENGVHAATDEQV